MKKFNRIQTIAVAVVVMAICGTGTANAQFGKLGKKIKEEAQKSVKHGVNLIKGKAEYEAKESTSHVAMPPSTTRRNTNPVLLPRLPTLSQQAQRCRMVSQRAVERFMPSTRTCLTR